MKSAFCYLNTMFLQQPFALAANIRIRVEHAIVEASYAALNEEQRARRLTSGYARLKRAVDGRADCLIAFQFE